MPGAAARSVVVAPSRMRSWPWFLVPGIAPPLRESPSQMGLSDQGLSRGLPGGSAPSTGRDCGYAVPSIARPRHWGEEMTEEEPLRHKVGLSAALARRYSRDTIVGSSFQQILDGAVITAGVVVNWIDGKDGTVTLVVEQSEL